MGISIALAGNPNSGKTTLFNALTGANQYVGNWPGVTVEKKHGFIKGHKDVRITDLPGIYSLSPYTQEEVVARNFLLDERPDVILNIVDGSNIERNLYLTTQLIELGIPVVVAINMMDVVRKSGVTLNTKLLGEKLGCAVVEISAAKGENVQEAAELAIEAARKGDRVPCHSYAGCVEHALAHIEERVLHDFPESIQKWYAIKIFEGDQKILDKIGVSQEDREHVQHDIEAAEQELGDDAETIITNARYDYIVPIVKECKKAPEKPKKPISEKIDSVVTNRVLGLPIFALVMFLIFNIAMVWVGQPATDWVNDNLFGDGFFVNSESQQAYEEAADEYAEGNYADKISGYLAAAEAKGIDTEEVSGAVDALAEDPEDADANKTLDDFVTANASFTARDVDLYEDDVPTGDKIEVTSSDFEEAVLAQADEPDPADYDGFIPSLTNAASDWLESLESPSWLQGLIVDGIIGGVGAVLGFVPQLMVLFICLAFIEECGYMARVAFVLDRLFRRFGLSGKSIIPMLISTGCGVPAIMSTRTIEEPKERRITVMTTTMIPCSAKLPIIALIAGAVMGGEYAAVITTAAYFGGIFAILISGLFLQRLNRFKGESSPFIMELPQYHLPKLTSVLKTMWDRAWAFIKKAGTIILLSTIVIWFLQNFGFAEGSFGMLEEDQIDSSILAAIGNALCWIFAPLGFGEWQTTVTCLTGLVAKENLVSTMSVIYGGSIGVSEFFRAMAAPAALAFLFFNLLCAPCFAAMGAIKREMNSARWFWFAIGYQCGFAYLVGTLVNQIGNIILGQFDFTGVVVLLVLIVAIIIWRMVDKKRQGKSALCDCGSCGGCPAKDFCHK